MKTVYSNLLTFFSLCTVPFYAAAQWSKPNPAFTQATSFAGISSPSSQAVWLAGRDTSQSVPGHRFARSTDGGQTWSHFTIPGFETYTPSNISAVGTDTAWVAMFNSIGGGGIFRTNDGGVNWSVQTSATFSAPSGFPNFVHFFDASNGVCMGDPNGGYFEIYTTANGGTSWSRVASANIPLPFAGEYGTVDKFSAAGNTIYFNTTSGRVFSSRNRGLTWTATPITSNGDTAYAYWAAAKSATEATAVISVANTYQIAKTTDGGLSWSTEAFTGTVQLHRAAYINGGGTSQYLLSFGGSVVQMSYDDGRHWAPFSAADLGNAPFPFEGSIATSANGNIWLGGRYLNTANTGVMKFSIPKRDVVTPGVIVGAGVTTCLSEDTVFASVINTGTDTIMFANNPLTIRYNVYSRAAGLPNFSLNTSTKTLNTGMLLPGENILVPSSAATTSFKNLEYYFHIVTTLTDTIPNLNFNDTSLFLYFNGITTTSLTNTSTGLPASTFYTGAQFKLNCVGNFTTIQWQQRSNAGTWTDISGANTADYTFSPSESAYYRAFLCGTFYSDSLHLTKLYGNAVGYTYYDNQTNASVNNRIATSGGKVTAVFTGSMDATNTATADRGSFYNHSDTATWGAPVASRLESIRTGFPSMTITASGKEVVVAHNGLSGKLVSSRRNTIGTGAWTETLDFAKGQWPRLTSASGDTIHLIALDTSVSLGAKIRYYRSSDAGATWDLAMDLPGYNTVSGFAITNAETYAIDAEGSVVAIVAGGYNNKFVLWKSVNSGGSWTTKTIKTFPAGFDGNTVTPLTATTDGIASVLVDHQHNTHVFTGKMFLQDDVAGDGNWNYFPNTDGLLYWNEMWPTDSLVEIASAAQTGYMAGTFVLSNAAGLSSYPSVSQQPSGNSMFVTYSVPVNNTEDSVTGVNRRDVYGIMSADGGNTWSVPQNLTNSAASGFDNSFASSANAPDTVHLLWQSSTTPVARNDGRINLKTLLHHAFPYTRFESITQQQPANSTACGNDSITVQYTAVGNFTTVYVELSDLTGSFASPTQIGVFSNTNTPISHKVRIPNTLKSGAYLVRISGSSGAVSPELFTINVTQVAPKPSIGNIRPLTFCSGDSTVLMVDTAQIGTHNHFWVVNGVVDSASYNKLMYTVKITASILVRVNAGTACPTVSDTVKVVRNLTQAVTATVTPDTTVCLGTALTLKAVVATGTPTSYQWRKDGVTTGTNSPNLVISTITATSGGKYTISINSQCAVYNSDTIDVRVNVAPVITLQPLPVTTCDGSTAVFRIRATSLTAATYQWKKGTQVLAGSADSLVIPNAAVTDTGSYTCTVTNTCGSTVSASAKLSLTQALSINSTLADTTLCKGSAFAYSLNVSGSGINYAWYKDTTLVGSGPVLTFNAVSFSDSGLYSARVSNSCGVLVSNIARLSVSDNVTSVSLGLLSGDTLVAIVSGTYLSITWYLNDSLIAGADDTLFIAQQYGSYKVRVTSAGGCINTSAPYVHNSTALAQNPAFANVTLYPNPANTSLQVSGLGNIKGNIVVSDLLGREVMVAAIVAPAMSLDLSGVHQGMYVVQVISADGSFVRKVQVQH